MLEKLEGIVKKYKEVEQQLCEPDIMSDLTRYRELSRKLSELKEVVDKYQLYKSASEAVNEARNILQDKEADSELARAGPQ